MTMQPSKKTTRGAPGIDEFMLLAAELASIVGFERLAPLVVVEFYNQLMLDNGHGENCKNSWAKFDTGLITEIELRNLVSAHLVTCFERANGGRRVYFTEATGREFSELIERWLYGRPAIPDAWDLTHPT